MSKTKTKRVLGETEEFPRKKIPLCSGPSNDEKGHAYAELVNSPELAAHRIVSMMQPQNVIENIDTPGMLQALRDNIVAVNQGDLSRPEAMLISQAAALQALFVRLIERAVQQKYIQNYEALMRIALRAQSQCRATLETLGTIKNPPTVFVKQTNVTSGSQQINNNTAGHDLPKETVIPQTQLSSFALEECLKI